MNKWNSMFVARSTCWNMSFGLNKGDANEDEEGQCNMQDPGENITGLLKKIGTDV